MASQNGALGEVARALIGVTFPAGKEDLAEFAHSSHPNDDLVHLIAQLPDRKYSTMAEIEEALAEAIRTPPSSRGQDGRMSERNTPRDTSSEHLEEIFQCPRISWGQCTRTSARSRARWTLRGYRSPNTTASTAVHDRPSNADVSARNDVRPDLAFGVVSGARSAD